MHDLHFCWHPHQVYVSLCLDRCRNLAPWHSQEWYFANWVCLAFPIPLPPPLCKTLGEVNEHCYCTGKHQARRDVNQRASIIYSVPVHVTFYVDFPGPFININSWNHFLCIREAWDRAWPLQRVSPVWWLPKKLREITTLAPFIRKSFDLDLKKVTFSPKRMATKARFEKEAKVSFAFTSLQDLLKRFAQSNQKLNQNQS